MVRAHGDGPALVHATVIRPYSHSLSDDERLYKRPRNGPRSRHAIPTALAAFLVREGIATREELDGDVPTCTRVQRGDPAAQAAATHRKIEPAFSHVYSPTVDVTGSACDIDPVFEGKPARWWRRSTVTLHDEMRAIHGCWCSARMSPIPAARGNSRR